MKKLTKKKAITIKRKSNVRIEEEVIAFQNLNKMEKVFSMEETLNVSAR